MQVQRICTFPISEERIKGLCLLNVVQITACHFIHSKYETTTNLNALFKLCEARASQKASVCNCSMTSQEIPFKGENYTLSLKELSLACKNNSFSS